jgi:hypothetical protein
VPRGAVDHRAALSHRRLQREHRAIYHLRAILCPRAETREISRESGFGEGQVAQVASKILFAEDGLYGMTMTVPTAGHMPLDPFVYMSTSPLLQAM